MSWGGARVGAGRKPKARRLQAVPVLVPSSEPLLTPPPALPTAQQDVWLKWAPLAIRRQTLIAENVPAFTLLCELEVRRAQIGAMADKEPTPELLRSLAQYAKQVEALLGRFRLAPFGKPEAIEKPKAVANPWGALGARG